MSQGDPVAAVDAQGQPVHEMTGHTGGAGAVDCCPWPATAAEADAVKVVTPAHKTLIWD